MSPLQKKNIRPREQITYIYIYNDRKLAVIWRIIN